VKVVLASGSPRRRELLGRLAVPFEIAVSRRPERRPHPGEEPKRYAEATALEKAREIRATHSDAIVIAGDTIVVADDTILGKPADPDEAFGMLSALAGVTHDVITGVAVLCAGEEHIASECTRVSMRRSSPTELREYIATGEPMDKAGAYAIQGHGGALISAIEGCLENVVGLPLCLVRNVLVRCGLALPDASCDHYRFSDGWPPDGRGPTTVG
jgi:septum formation protein